LALLSAGLPDNPNIRQQLRPQVIRQLVDERLQLQEAKRVGVVISPAEVDAGIDRLAKQNGTTRANLLGMLSGRGVPASTLKAQTQAALAWQRVLQRRMRQDISISGEEVDAAYDRLKAEIGKPEYLLAEIFLAVDKPSQDAEVQRLAQKLSDDLKRGANFVAVARQFSQSAGAANGGDLGWVRPGDLRNELDATLKNLRPGQLSAPVRSADGYHILLVRAQRAVGSKTVTQAPPPPRPRAEARPDIAKATVNMRQLMFPAAANTDEARNAAKSQAEAARKSIKSCSDFNARAQSMGQGDTADMGTVKVKDMQAQLGQLVVSLPVGQPSPVLSGPGGALVLIVCSRNVPMIEPPREAAAPPPPPQPVNDARLPTRDEVESDIINQRGEALSRRYLRDLRRAAFIETR
jgi:peptidyl-prolyl cis-trans isomerase SurA